MNGEVSDSNESINTRIRAVWEENIPSSAGRICVSKHPSTSRGGPGIDQMVVSSTTVEKQGAHPTGLRCTVDARGIDPILSRGGTETSSIVIFRRTA